MRYPEDLTGWPMADHSSRVFSRPHEWHIQSLGRGPELLFLHGAGGATHSWRDVIPALSDRFRCIAVDLPGHGFTGLGSRHRSSLDCMSDDLINLASQQGWRLRAVIGHSAGGAVALRIAQKRPQLNHVVAINPALQPFDGIAGLLFPAIARTIASLPFAVDIARRTLVAPDRAKQLLAGTGSDIGPEGVALYQRLLRDRDHVEGALQMMAQWKLDGLLADLPRIEAGTLILLGARDRAVPPETGRAATARMPNARAETYPDLGHLAHEEAPDRIAGRIAEFVTEN